MSVKYTHTVEQALFELIKSALRLHLAAVAAGDARTAYLAEKAEKMAVEWSRYLDEISGGGELH